MYTAEGCRCEVLIMASCGNLVQSGQIQAIMKDSKELACKMGFGGGGNTKTIGFEPNTEFRVMTTLWEILSFKNYLGKYSD